MFQNQAGVRIKKSKSPRTNGGSGKNIQPMHGALLALANPWPPEQKQPSGLGQAHRRITTRRVNLRVVC
jgi:hypothetical protein